MKIVTTTQGDESWRLARLGIPTASAADSIITPKKRELSTQRKPYMAQLLAEWFFGREVTSDSGSGGFMGRGTSLEDEAVAWLELETGMDIERVGFCTLDDGSFGWSLDGWCSAKNRNVECKAPGPAKHIANLLDPDAFVAAHFGQVQTGLMGTGRSSAWLLCYHPSLPAVLRVVERDEAYIAAFRTALAQFTSELAAAKARPDLMEAKARLLALSCEPAAREAEPVTLESEF